MAYCTAICSPPCHVGITTVANKNDPNFGLLTIDEKKLDIFGAGRSVGCRVICGR